MSVLKAAIYGKPWQGPLNGLVYRWPLTPSSTSGTTSLERTTTNSRHATWGSSVRFMDAPFVGGAATFFPNDANGYADVGATLLPNIPEWSLGGFSISVWVHRATYTASDTFDSGDARGFCFLGSGGSSTVILHVGGSGVCIDPGGAPAAAASGVLPVLTWIHIGHSYDGLVQGRMYVNGVDATVATSFGDAGSANNTIGARATGARPWGGGLYNLCIYNRVLTPGEFHQLYLAR